MKILKIFGMVVAVHAAVFMFIFAIPGCRSSGKQQPAAVTSAPPVDTVGASPVAAVSDAPSPQSQVLFSPTRPGTAAAASIEAAPSAEVQTASTYTVVKGDNLWSIAKKNGTTTKELAAANNLPSTTSLRLGQKLIIPGKKVAAVATTGAAAETLSYTVKSGDTLASIAHHAGTTPVAIKSANKLKSDVVRTGQVLVLPAGGSSVPTKAAAVETTAAASSGATMTHIVKAGDTLGSIARKYQVKMGDLATANNIADPTKLRVGQKLKIPGWQTPASAKAPASAPVSPAPSFTPAPATDFSPVAPATESPLFPGSSSPSPLVSPATDSSSAAPVIKVEGTGAPQMN